MNKLDKAIQALAEAKAKVMANQADLNAVQANKDKLKAEVVELGKKIAEAKKPELRDGDYGPDENGQMSIALARGGGEFFYYQRGVNSNHPGYKPVTVLGNIFDDLKALQEDVTEFETVDGSRQNEIEVDFTEKHLRIVDKDAGGHLAITIENLPDFILKLRQIQATLKRNEAKK